MMAALLVFMSLITLSSPSHIEMCCTFKAALQRDISVLSSMITSVGHKLIMGCSTRPQNKCGCFENVWGCQKVTITDLSTKTPFEVENGHPSFIFDQVMREVHPPTRGEKGSRHVSFCGDSTGTPYVWSLITSGNATWSMKKHCMSDDMKYEIRLRSHMVMGIRSFTQGLKWAVAHFSSAFDKKNQVEKFVIDGISDLTSQVYITTTSELAFKNLSEKLNTMFRQINSNFIPYKPTAHFKLHMEEIIMEFQEFKCRSYNFQDCLSILYFVEDVKSQPTLYHLSADLLDLYLTTTQTPAVIVIYTHNHYDETQDLVVTLDNSLSRSTLATYSVAMMEESPQFKVGVYYILYPNSIKKCTDDVYRCLTKQFQVYLPPPDLKDDNNIVLVVFGEQHIDQENYHRGNFNQPWFYQPPEEISFIEDIKTKLKSPSRVIQSRTTSLKVLNQEQYYKSIASERGNFILFVFRSDISSLYTIKSILETNISGIQLVECFDLNLVCSMLEIRTYPMVLFARNNDTMPYHGPLEEVALKTFRELIEHPVVTKAHRIQVDLVLKGGEYKSAVMISSGNRNVKKLFKLACNELYGLIRCYMLDSNNPTDDTLIIHVPEDPVMINKKYLPKPEDDSVEKWVGVINKLATHSVISERELLLHYRNLTDIVLFDMVLDDELALTVNHFPVVQFVQISSPEFKNKLLRELIGYDYEDSVLFISKTRNCGYKFPEEATLETWVKGVLEDKLLPDFELKDLEGSKYQYQDIYYKNQFKVFEKSVRSMREKVDELNSNIGRRATEWKSHQEL